PGGRSSWPIRPNAPDIASGLGSGRGLKAVGIVRPRLRRPSTRERAEFRLEPVGIEGQKPREGVVLGTVVIGGAGAEDLQLGAPLDEQLGLLARMGDVEGLHAVEAG